LATNPNDDLPLSDESAVYAPAGESIQPPPVAKPELPSKTTIN
jgi:hypothetical protein